MKNKKIFLLMILCVCIIFFTLIDKVFSLNVAYSIKKNKSDLSSQSILKNRGNVSYKLVRVNKPNEDELSAYKLIQQIMDSAINYYNLYTTASKQITVYYVADKSVRADGNFNGNLRFGPDRTFMNVGTATHEISHTIGVGTNSKWQSFEYFCAPNEYTTFSGKNATDMLRQITGNPNAQIFMDSQHFWPYGLNYASEYKAESDVINHCKIVNAMIKDGL